MCVWLDQEFLVCSRCATSNVIQNCMPWKLSNKSYHQKNHFNFEQQMWPCGRKAWEEEEKKIFWLLSAVIVNSACLLAVQHGGFIERCFVPGGCADGCSVFICSTAGWLSVKLGFGVIPVVMRIWCRKREAVITTGVKHSPTQCSVGFQLRLLSP